MPQFETTRLVKHAPDKMFALVADIEKYPEFLPLCESLTVRSRKERDGRAVLVADMSIGYKAIRETFTTQVLLKPDE
jgi:coenzyme Q-binding protein COQ10